MQMWRATEQEPKSLSMSEEPGIPASWLLGLAGDPLKAVSLHRLARSCTWHPQSAEIGEARTH